MKITKLRAVCSTGAYVIRHTVNPSHYLGELSHTQVNLSGGGEWISEKKEQKRPQGEDRKVRSKKRRDRER